MTAGFSRSGSSVISRNRRRDDLSCSDQCRPNAASAMLFPLCRVAGLRLRRHTRRLKETDVLRMIVRTSCAVALLVVASIAVGQTEFSADVVHTGQQKQDRGPTKV